MDRGEYSLPEEVSARLISPALIIYLDRVRENIATILGHMGGDAGLWRPHVKTTKIPAVFQAMAAQGVRHFKTANTRETVVLAASLSEENIDADILLSFPLIGPALTRLGEIARDQPQHVFSVLCESPEAVSTVPDEVGVFVDINPGMDRTGILLSDPARVLDVARAAGVRFRGVHFYEGHLHSGSPEDRQEQAFSGYEALMEVVSMLEREGIPVGEICTSGTPAFLHALAFPRFQDLDGTSHRVSPGTVVFHDQRTEERLPELDLAPAALVLVRIVSHPRPGLVTSDGGSKSIAAEVGDPCAIVLGRRDLRACTPSEEHLPFEVMAGSTPQLGDLLLLVPRHVCPTINLAETALLIESGRLVGVVEVAARGHETGFSPSR